MSDSTNGTGSAGSVEFCPTANPTTFLVDSTTGKTVLGKTSSEVVLAHELIHSQHGKDGTIDTSLDSYTYIDINGKSQVDIKNKEELRTVGFGNNTHGDITENVIRKEQGACERAIY